MRCVLVTGAASPLGHRLVARLATRHDVATVVAVDRHRSPVGAPRVRVVTVDNEYRGLNGLLRQHQIDTVIHAALAPHRNGSTSRLQEADVIGTLQLCAAVAHRDGPVRAFVIASSSEIYPASSRAPIVHGRGAATAQPGSGVAGSLREAEDYVAEVAERSPHLCVSILRLVDLVGDGVAGPLATLLTYPLVPYLAGFDPWVQVLHLDDAAAALEHAATRQLSGTFDVAAGDPIRWRQAARLARRQPLPMPTVSAGPFEPLLSAAGLPYLPERLFDLLRFGRGVDTTALAGTGWRPAKDTEACVRRGRFEARDLPNP